MVLNNFRNISRYEFEKNYTEFVKDIKPQITKCSKRRKRYVATPLNVAIMEAFNDILKLHTYLFTPNKSDKEIEKKMTKQAINSVYKLQRPLLVFWNIQMTEFETQCRFAKMLNRELSLLYGILNKFESQDNSIYNNQKNIQNNANKGDKMEITKFRDRKYPKSKEKIYSMPYRFIVLDVAKIKSMDVTRNAAIFHRFVHSKVIRATHDLENGSTPLLVKMVDDFFYNVMTANAIYPKTPQEFQDRERRLKMALNSLKYMQVPLYSYFDLMDYSEDIMVKFADFINNEEKYLNGLMRSDRKNFAHLIIKDKK